MSGDRRNVARLIAAVVLLASMSAERIAAQSIQVNAGASPTARVLPGGKLTVPIIVDMAAAGTLNVAGLSVALNWGSATLTFDSLRTAPGLGWTFTPNVAGAAGGTVAFVTSNSSSLSGTSTIANLFLTASATASGTRITPSISSATNAAQESILASMRPRRLDVCVALTGKWGDATNDNLVNIVDAQQVARFSVGLSVADANAIAKRGDVTNDALVNIIDAQQIARYSVALTASARTGNEAYVQPIPTAVTISPSVEQRIPLTGTVQMTATPLNATGNLTGCESFLWTSSNPFVASVNGTGFVTGLSFGSAQITATALSNPSLFVATNFVVEDPATIRLSISHVGRPARRYIAEVTGSAFPDIRGFAIDGINMNAATMDIPVPSTGSYTVRMVAIDAASSTNHMAVAGAAVTVNVVAGGITSRVLALSAPTYTMLTVPTLARLGSTVAVSWRVADPSTLIDGPERGVIFCGAVHTSINTLAADFGGTQSDACGVTVNAQGTLTFSNSTTPVAAQLVPGTLRMQMRATQLVRTGTGAGTDILVHWVSPSITRGESPLSISVPPLTQVQVVPASPTLAAGTTQQMSVVAQDGLGAVTGLPVVWSITSPSVATISPSGLVTGVASGQSEVVATVATANGSTVLTVSGAITIGSITVSVPPLSGNAMATAVAVVRDPNGNEIPNAALTWASSNFRVARVTETGVVQALGSGTTQIAATTTGFSGVATVTVPPTPAAFNIVLRPASVMSPSVTSAFNAAAQRWSQIIRGDVADVSLPGIDVSVCLNQPVGTTVLNEAVDDVIIYSQVTTIDGAGGILAAAGPCMIRGTNGQTIVGAMIFDEADIASIEADGSLTAVILHEMGHVLGIGTNWGSLLLNPAPAPGTGDPTFAGTNALWTFSKLGTGYGGASVPVENCCGDGTRNAHWRESVLQRELMTGFITVGGGLNPLSPLTAASLIDIGYVVDVNQSDFPPSFLRGGALQEQPTRAINERVLMPRMLLDPAGRVSNVSTVRAPVIPPALRRN